MAEKYVSRGGLKLEAALSAFGIDPTGWTCIDFGSHTGGFVDCLVQHGASKVYAVDPGYGILDYNLRNDERVIPVERTNAMKYESPEPADLLTMDVGWTPQRLILPAARRCVKTPGGMVISLIKPQYEAPKDWLNKGVVDEAKLDEVCQICREDIEELGWTIAGEIDSPILGHGGNKEFLWWLKR